MESTPTNSNSAPSYVPTWLVIVAWLWAGLPLAWGVVQTLHKAADLFNK